MLTKETRNLLKSVSGISSTAVIEYPITPICPQDKSVIAFVDVSETESQEFNKFGAYFLTELLSVLDYFDDANVDLRDNVLHISGVDGSCEYETTELSVIEGKFYVDPTKYQAMKNANSVMEFDLSKEMMQKINKLSGLLKLNHLVIDFRDKSEIILTNFTEMDKYQNPTRLNINVEVNERYAIVIDVRSFQTVPVDDYKARIIISPKGNLTILLMSQTKPIGIVVSILEQFQA
jgi:hypothetical protein